MNIVHASFQASFDSRVDHLSHADLEDLHAIFRYFDTDDDGKVSAGQACRMFALLGLDVNITHVHELGEVYLDEFIKIVDSHVQVSPSVASPKHEVHAVENRHVQQNRDPSENDLEKDLRFEQSVESEWKLLDTHRRGYVSQQELSRFLINCQSNLSSDDMERFLEMYGDLTSKNNIEEGRLTKAGFIKFQREYKNRNIQSLSCVNNTDNQSSGITQSPDKSSHSTASKRN
ncbi:EF-hand domain pair [Plasmopara halstedii]|uniref:EF-hand domain pair n=1 Tax=Plasmopara halstedii TaxID=4781 RepID=A0A0N7L378_PLAHL|nr:EF-hand domain pair [Plasmopara halstedii]CEG35115.1 EF-hand domain pair [Plasmopara halstedii]|eukprot:XP_024571484.1 EF-hand domain pair [Plasmopara halstedii]